ncbi:fatty acid synthase-like isoform X2 [Maniola jurtina]|uniref:fatty acid synthase-like isoform X2 n=1 Tax=Maniola jurtina TaxID=191418 RepID=UPI001E68EF0B|nr:fatty acid synthase-like isoform X2 [Maniola jurtina]
MAPTPKNLPSWEERNPVDTTFGKKVVISGISGLYPESHNVKDLSDILYNKINPVNKENSRWKYDHPEVAQYTGKVPGLKLFDAQFFKVHYRLGNNMDPMARKMLEQSYQAIYDAGVCPEELSGKKIGVYIGSCFSETDKACFYVAGSRTGFGIAGCSKSMFANRISYWLNAKGPSMSIDEACCSSTGALEQAYRAISRGECEAAIVGGSSLCLHPQSSIHYGRLMKLSMDGKTKSFDTEAAGCAKSEAINVLFLQKAKDALRIYAEVVHIKCEFTSITQDETRGPRYGFYRDPENMANFMSNFYKEAKIPPQAVEYVEGFGSAVPEADKAELEAFEKVFCDNRNDPLLVGSVMSNIGYGEAASGISAITKVILGYHSGQLAGNLNCDSPRKDIAALRDGRMRIVTDHETFGRSYTAVNGLSVSGVNAHVLLNGHYKPKDLSRYKANIPRLIFLSGRQESSVNKILQDLKSRPIDAEEIALLHNIHKARIAGHLGRGFILLDTNEKNETVSLSEKANYYDDATRPLWFVYSGMGSQWAGMGAQLMRIPVFAAAIEKCRRVLEPKGVDIVHIITSPDKTIFDNILNSFVGIAAIQIGLTDILRALEIVPDKIIGHSVGELGCAYADGCFTAEEMILSAYSRGLVSVQTPFIRGSMAAVGVGYQQISKMCPPEIEVACHNGPDSSTISGPADTMKEFVAQLTAKEIFAKEVPCSNIAYHSRYIAEAGPGLLQYLGEVIKSPKARSERWVSTSVPQEEWNKPIAKYSSAEYHTNNLLNSVLFEETSRLIPANAVVVEIAPHGLLQAILKRSLPESCKNVPLTRRGHPDNAQFLLEAIGNLYMEGYSPQIQALYPKVEFPVSTGTPMLSHLLEWAHNEAWNVPLYVSANRKTAAACTHVLSIHDDDHRYLKGHVIREKNTYPFAATLVAVWDTLAMVLGVPKKQLSVEFRDVHLHSEPVLHDQRQLRLNITVHRGRGQFEVLDDNIKVATGFIISEIDKHISSQEEFKTEEVLLLNSEDIYQLLSARDYNYSNEFRSIHKANLSLDKAHLLWENNWVTLIDGMIQLNALKRIHESVSQPNFIRRIIIDVEKHTQDQTLVVDDANVMLAKLCEVLDSTRCGGVLIENIKFHDLPSINKEQIALKTLKFVPHVSTNNFDENSALYILLQILAENLNKQEINIANIVEYKNQRNFANIGEIINDIPEIKINLFEICRDDLPKKPDDFFEDIDALMITNLASDDNMCQVLHRLLNRDTLLINKEVCADLQTVRPSLLYRTMCAHTIGSSRLELDIWRPSDVTAGTSAVTMFSPADLTKLDTQLSTLPSKHRLVILTSYPAFDGLKDTVKKWRNKDHRKINLVIINHKLVEEQSLSQMPFTDLAVSILDHGVWGGEYYLPIQGKIAKGKEMALEMTRLGDIDSMHWIEVTGSSHQGIPVKVHYAGLNDAYVKKVLRVAATENNNNDRKLVEYSFSGTTDRKERVMGIVQEESICTRVVAKPELLWPVPEHWTLEDAATVPLAYCLAFYCLCFKSRFYRDNSILVHGGTGALGQAIISIALAHNCDIYTTVSNLRKKKFLLRLFPDLKEDHIGCSRDSSFRDMVRRATNGKGCDIVINSVKGDLRNASLNCCKAFGSIVDTSLLLDTENYNFGLVNLSAAVSFSTLQFSSLFEPQNVEDLKRLQLMVSEGIARGYVRPLSRVVYPAAEAARAVRLQAGSKHLGRVLLHLEEDMSYTHHKINCSADRLHLLLSENDVLGMQLAERLISRGARKLALHCSEKSNSLLFKLRSWEERGVQCTISYGNTWSENIFNLLNSKTPENIEGIYCILNSNGQNENISKCLENLTLTTRRSNWSIRYFALIDARKGTSDHIKITKPHDQFTTIKLLPLKFNGNVEDKEYFSVSHAIDAIEKSLCYKQRIIAAHDIKKSTGNLLEEVAYVADISVNKGTPQDFTLKDMGMDESKSKIVRAYLRDVHNILLEETIIPLLTLKKIRELEDKTLTKKFTETKDLETFFSHVDQDELLATTEMVFVPTLTTSATMRDDEFDVSQTFLCIVPGVEGLHVRFRELGERLKLPALVLQPGVDRPHETIQEMAQRYAKILLKRTQLKERFYLLGYESGVLVALEMAAILEDHGLTGKVFCIGGSPDEILAKFEEKLANFETEESLQVAVARHMFNLIMNGDNPEDLEEELKKISSWKQKVYFCVQKLRGRIDYSIQYARELIEAAYARIVQIRRYHSEPRPLRSLLISIRPWLSASNHVNCLSLQRYSQEPVIEYELKAPLAYSAQDLRCAAIVNRHLDNDLIEDFDKRNLCETYIINADSFMTTADNVDDYLF